MCSEWMRPSQSVGLHTLSNVALLCCPEALIEAAPGVMKLKALLSWQISWPPQCLLAT